MGFTTFFRLKDFRLKAVRGGHGTRLGREKVYGLRYKVFLFGRLGPALPGVSSRSLRFAPLICQSSVWSFQPSKSPLRGVYPPQGGTEKSAQKGCLSGCQMTDDRNRDAHGRCISNTLKGTCTQ
jgi:hypothetical protein